MQFALVTLLVGVDEHQPLSASDWEELERIATLPHARTPHLEALYLAALPVVRHGGVKDPAVRAFGAAIMSIGAPFRWELGRRAQLSQEGLSEEQRRRRAAALWAIGAAYARQHTVLEKLQGALLLKDAAELSGDPNRIREADELMSGSRQTFRQFRRICVDGWPLASLREEIQRRFVRAEYETMESMVSGGQ